MPRKARKLSSCGVYHIMIRGINRMTIFNDDADNLNFLHILDFCADENFIIMAYCLMGNHLHLLAKDCNDSLQHMMKAIGVRYVAYYNRRYQRTGPLFQGRYKSQPVTTKGYFLRVLRYIHRNPVAAGMVQDMQDYPWSSYIDYFASRKKPLCHVDTSYALALHDLDWLRHYHQQPELNARGILEDSPLPAFTDAELCDGMPRNPALPRIHRNPAAAPSGNTRGRQHYTTLTAYRDGTRRHPPPSAVSGDTTLKGEIP